MFDEDGYPTEEILEEISKWDVTQNPVEELLKLLQNVWWCGQIGVVIKGKRILKVTLHTWGWSGNESIIGALKRNFIFWNTYWQKSRRGGHYYFRIPLRRSR